MKKLTNMQETAIANARRAAVMMSTEKFPVRIETEKMESDAHGCWLTLDTHTVGGEGTALDFYGRNHWFIRITRRGKATIHQGPHWAEKGVYGMHADRDGYFGG